MSTPPPEPGMIKGCTLERLRSEGIVRLRLLGKPIGILETVGGRILARELSCKHQGADLSGGDREGSLITCPRHGWQYDLATGDCVVPAGGVSLREHPVAVVDDVVWVGLTPSPRCEPY